MGDRKHVYRLVVDHWPTEDGQPFTEQPIEWWESVAGCAVTNHDDPECACPAWLPNDLSPWLARSPGNFLNMPSHTRRIYEPGDSPDYATGYPGDPGYDVIAVPDAPTRRFFGRSGVVAMAVQLRQWGCRAHVERAPIGDWHPLDGVT